MGTGCNADHEYYVADVAEDHESGTVTVIAVCRHCGEFKIQRVQVTQKGNA